MGFALSGAVLACDCNCTAKTETPHKHEHTEAEAKPAVAKIGEAAPAFTLKDHNGKDVSLADLKGKPVVLLWTNPGCPFVKRHFELGTQNALVEAHKDVTVLAINSSNFASVEKNKASAEQYKLNYAILDDHEGSVGKAYAAKTTPHAFVIDANGVLVYEGAIDSHRATEGPAPKGTVNYVDATLAHLAKGEAVSMPHTKPYGCSVKYAH